MKKSKNFNLANSITMIRILLIPFLIFFIMIQINGFNTNKLNYRGLNYAWVVISIYFIASISDFIDGQVARRKNQITTLGKFLDSMADKILVCVMLLMLTVYLEEFYSLDPVVRMFRNKGLVDYLAKTKNTEITYYYRTAATTFGYMKRFMIILTTVVIVREFLISGLRQMGAAKNVIIQADMIGKIKTAITLITIGLQLCVPLGLIRIGKLMESEGSSIIASNNLVLYNQHIFEQIKILYNFLILIMVLWGIVLVLTVISAGHYLVKNKKVFED